jgi:hypothetical protein
MRGKLIWQVIEETGSEWVADRAPRMGAAPGVGQPVGDGGAAELALQPTTPFMASDAPGRAIQPCKKIVKELRRHRFSSSYRPRRE